MKLHTVKIECSIIMWTVTYTENWQIVDDLRDVLINNIGRCREKRLDVPWTCSSVENTKETMLQRFPFFFWFFWGKSACSNFPKRLQSYFKSGAWGWWNDLKHLLKMISHTMIVWLPLERFRFSPLVSYLAIVTKTSWQFNRRPHKVVFYCTFFYTYSIFYDNSYRELKGAVFGQHFLFIFQT